MVNLYDGDEYFKLIHNGVEEFIDEPIRWSQALIKLKEDEEYFGFNYEFFDPEADLIFAYGYGGAETLKAIYAAQGGDGQCTFIFGVVEGIVYRDLITQTLNFNDYKLTDEGISLTIEKTNFESKLRTRFDSKVSLNATKDLDGNTITPLAPVKVKLHSKKIVRVSIQKTDPAAPVDSFGTWFNADNPYNVYLQVDTTNIIASNVEDLVAAPGGMQDNPLTTSQYTFKAAEAGVIQFEASGSVGQLRLSHAVVPMGTVTITPVVKIVRAASTIYTSNEDPIFSAFTNNAYMDVNNLNYSMVLNYGLEVDDEIYFYLLVNSTQNAPSFSSRFYNHISNLTVKQETTAQSSVCNCYKLFDVLNFLILSCTGQENKLISEFLQSGCGSNYYITNGYQIRNFEVFDRPVTLTMNTVLKSINALWCIGVGFVLKEDGDFVYVEPRKRFKNDNHIYDFANVSDYSEEHDKSLTFNEVEIGYEKFIEDKDETNTLDEFNTVREYLLPITTYKEKKPIKCDFVASGYAIEFQRREQFSESPTESTEWDDEIFIIDTAESYNYELTARVIETTKLQTSKTLPVDVGDFVEIEGDSVLREVTEVNLIADGEYIQEIIFTPAGTNQSGTLAISITSENLMASRDEKFELVENVLSADTSYNLSISPARMFQNWSDFFNAGLYLKSGASQIKCLFAKNNGLARTKYKDGYSCLLTQNQDVIENEDIQLSNYGGRQAVELSKMFSFSSDLPFTDFESIVNKLRGVESIDESGYVTFKNIENQTIEGRIKSIEYDPVSRKASIICRLRIGDLV